MEPGEQSKHIELNISPESYQTLGGQVSNWIRSGSLEGDVYLHGHKEDLFKFALTAKGIINQDWKAIWTIDTLAGTGKPISSGYRQDYFFQLNPVDSQNPEDSKYKLRIMGYRPDIYSKVESSKRRHQFYERVIKQALEKLKPR